MARRRDASELDGVLIVAKPPGPTSHDVVALVRRLSGTRQVGHGGTLDPFASGGLPLCLGGATRLVEYHLGDRKRYRATACFGASSTTDDLEGVLTPIPGPVLDGARIEAALSTFRGAIRQRPLGDQVLRERIVESGNGTPVRGVSFSSKGDVRLHEGRRWRERSGSERCRGAYQERLSETWCSDGP